jgi:HEAT repeat protein
MTESNPDNRSLMDLCVAIKDRDEARASSATRRLAGYASAPAIDALVDALGRTGPVAQAATVTLVELGASSVERVVAALDDPNVSRRWHALRVLTEMALPGTVPRLIASLNDEDAGVRWQAVHALAAIGLPALEPLLCALQRDYLSAWFAAGAHRVLQRLAPLVPQLRLERLTRDLEHDQAHVAAPLEAHRLLCELRASGVAAHAEAALASTSSPARNRR